VRARPRIGVALALLAALGGGLVALPAAAATTLADVLAANARAQGTPAPEFAQRRERYVYRNGAQLVPVEVAVRGADYRASVRLGAAHYGAGRANGFVWRSDANGVAHGTLSDLQGDPLDRLPRSLFAYDPSDCTLVGETKDGRAWILADRPAGDQPHLFFVDRASGLVLREVMHEGKRTVTTIFSDFAPIAGTLRPRRWHVQDGDPADDLDVRVEAIEPGPVDAASVAVPPSSRVFAPSDPAARSVALPVRFDGPRAIVEVDLGGHRAHFLLDTGTASIILDRGLAARWGFAPLLGHANVPRMAVGALVRSDVAVLTASLEGFGAIQGILGYDFFVGNVVHLDYVRGRVEVLARDGAADVFQDPATTVLSADVSEGMPLVHAAFGPAAGERFALDTGSPHLVVLAPFTRRNAAEVAAHWSPVAFGDGRPRQRAVFLEGGITLAARQVAAFQLGPTRFTRLTVGVEQPDAGPDAITIPLDGIVGTDQLSHFDLWFDYEGGRIGMRAVEMTAGG
jgi:hypothetical protein